MKSLASLRQGRILAPRRPDRLPFLDSRQAAALGIGIIVLATLAVLCVRESVGLIQADLGERTATALAAHDMRWADVAVTGRVVTLTGAAPSGEARAAAVERAKVWGVRRVQDRLAVVQVVAPTFAEAVAYELTFEFDGAGLRIAGTVSDRDTRDRLLRAAAQRFTAGGLTHGIREAGGAPDGWLAAATAALPIVAALERGAAVLRNSELAIRGTVPDAAASARLKATLDKALPPGYHGTAVLDISAAGVAGAAPVSDCQRRFDEVLGRSQIVFRSGSTNIDDDSRALLAELAKIALACPEARIEIAGHTDDRGEARANLELSQQRAEFVMLYLVDMGVPLRRLVARGYGEGRPLTSNATAAGRARNRRIEFIVETGP